MNEFHIKRSFVSADHFVLFPTEIRNRLYAKPNLEVYFYREVTNILNTNLV